MGRLTTELWGRFCIIVGTATLVLIGRDRFYLFAQRPTGLMPAICRRFVCHPYVRKVVTDFIEIEDDIAVEERSSASLAIYADHSLAGYADEQMKHGDSHNPLLDQMRSIIVPHVEEAIREAGNTPTTIVEIGTGNGDVIAYLAEKYSQHNYIGVDLSVKVATEKYQLPNLSFVDGYALDLLRRGAVVGDIVFATSTFVVFPPKELENYVDTLSVSPETL
ncbi:MAG: class I SAM-dependent methyltransferase [Alphaproteobacteria bacterium]